MPDRDVKTIRDLIYYQYAKLVARSAFKVADGETVKGKHYGFIKTTFRDLRAGKKSWSDITHEDKQFVQADKVCIYCGASGELQWEHIVRRSIGVKAECATCPWVQGIHNQIWACGPCNLAKGTKGLYEFFRHRHTDEKKFYDHIPSLLEKKYLKTVHRCHECAGTLDGGDLDGDAKLTVLDIDAVVHTDR